MKSIFKPSQTTMLLIFIFSTTLNVVGQTVPVGKYDTTNYPKDREIINSINNSFDKSLSLNDNYVGIGADGKMSFGIQSELETKTVDVVFNSPKGDVHFKVIRAETFIKQNGKWYFVLGQGTNFMTQEEFNEYRNLHSTKN